MDIQFDNQFDQIYDCVTFKTALILSFLKRINILIHCVNEVD